MSQYLLQGLHSAVLLHACKGGNGGQSVFHLSVAFIFANHYRAAGIGQRILCQTRG